MRAVVFSGAGGPEVMRVAERPAAVRAGDPSLILAGGRVPMAG